MSGSKIRTQTQILRKPQAAGPGRRRPILIVVQGEELGRRYSLGGRSAVLGREPTQVDLPIVDPSVSARHARIEIDVDADRYVISDLGSRNGTYVNGNPVGSQPLHEGDKIWLGGTVLKFTFHDQIEDQFHGELDRRMHLDSLTGLYARRWFDIEYPKAFARARYADKRLCVLMMDMDGLKRINDTRGHQVGSHCVAEVGKLIKRCLPPEAAGARFGGDEFVAYVPDMEADDAVELAHAIRTRVESHPFQLGPAVVAPTISIGVAALIAGVSTPEDLVRLADDALYRVKKRGGNAVCV